MSSKASRRSASRGVEPERNATAELGLEAPLSAPEGPQIWVVDAASAGERLDRFLGQRAAAQRLALSRTRLKALIESGQVKVDEAVASDPSKRILTGARVEFVTPPPEDSPLVGEDLPLEVVYEDKHLIVIDKPAGLVVHPAPGHSNGTLVHALIRRCGESLSGVGGVRRP